LRDGERRRLVEIRRHLCNEFSISDRVVLHHLELLVENDFVDKEMSGIYRITASGRNVLDAFAFIEEDRKGFI
jgi:predicted transcriptional regulator